MTRLPLLDPLWPGAESWGCGAHTADGDGISKGVTLRPHVVGAQLPGASASLLLLGLGVGGPASGWLGGSRTGGGSSGGQGRSRVCAWGTQGVGGSVQDRQRPCLSVQGPYALGIRRPTPQGCLEASWLPWPSGSQRALLTPLGGSGWLSSAGCVMTRPGFALLTARSSSSDCSLSSTEVTQRVCRWHPGCCRAAHR